MSGSTALHVSFAGGTTGAWRVVRMRTLAVPPLTVVDRVAVVEGRDVAIPRDRSWVLRGVTSDERYVRADERSALLARQPSVGRPEATLAALIPIRKSAAWWGLSWDERQAIFEERSHHIATGLEYLTILVSSASHSIS